MNFISTQRKKIVLLTALIGGFTLLPKVANVGPSDTVQGSLLRPVVLSEIRERLNLAFHSVVRDLNEARRRVGRDKHSLCYYAESIDSFAHQLGVLATELVALDSTYDPFDKTVSEKMSSLGKRLKELSCKVGCLWFEVNGLFISSSPTFDDEVFSPFDRE